MRPTNNCSRASYDTGKLAVITHSGGWMSIQQHSAAILSTTRSSNAKTAPLLFEISRIRSSCALHNPGRAEQVPLRLPKRHIRPGPSDVAANSACVPISPSRADETVESPNQRCLGSRLKEAAYLVLLDIESAPLRLAGESARCNSRKRRQRMYCSFLA